MCEDGDVGGLCVRMLVLTTPRAIKSLARAQRPVSPKLDSLGVFSSSSQSTAKVQRERTLSGRATEQSVTVLLSPEMLRPEALQWQLSAWLKCQQRADQWKRVS